jgi:hypothetical protein
MFLAGLNAPGRPVGNLLFLGFDGRLKFLHLFREPAEGWIRMQFAAGEAFLAKTPRPGGKDSG